MVNKTVAKIKKQNPNLIFRYSYVFQGGLEEEIRLVFRDKNCSHYEFSLDGVLLYMEE